MGKIRVTLSRRIGPFSLGIWLVIVVAGVGLGLILRRRFSSSDPGGGTVEPAFPSDGLTGPVSGGVNPGFAPVTVTRTETVETVDREALQDLVSEVRRAVNTGTDVPVSPGTGTGQQSETPGRKSTPVDTLAPFRTAVIDAYRTEGVDPPNTATIARIALEVQQGRSVQQLRQLIRRNEAAQGRTSAAQSRAYWSKQTDKAGVPGV